MSDHRVKISVKSDHHALQNLSSNPTDKVTEFDSKDLEFSDIEPFPALNLNIFVRDQSRDWWLFFVGSQIYSQSFPSTWLLTGWTFLVSSFVDSTNFYTLFLIFLKISWSFKSIVKLVKMNNSFKHCVDYVYNFLSMVSEKVI